MILALLIGPPNQIRVTTDSELRAALQNPKPGTTIHIAPGTYRGTQITNLKGTPENPITLAGADPKSPPRFTSGLQFSNIAHVEIKNLTIIGATTNGLNIDDGGNLENPSQHVKISGLQISDLPKGNHDGLKLSGVQDFQVTNSSFTRWGGSGIDMVGCHRGLITTSTFKEGGDSGIQAKGGSSNITIQRCTFVNAGQRALNLGGSTGEAFFRPTLAAMGNAKFEAKNLTVEGCEITGATASIAFVGVDGAQVRFNTIRNPDRWPFRILQETRSPGFLPARNGRIENNLILTRERATINIGDATDPASFRFSGNWWFASNNPKASQPQLPTPETNGTYGQNPDQTNPLPVGATAWKP